MRYHNNSRAHNAISVYLNPFSTKTTQPKIPDGKTNMSLGIRQNVNMNITNDDAPTITCLIRAHNTTPLEVDGAAVSNTDYQFPVADNANSKWRVVSQAARFMLINNNDNNEGWFEAARISDYALSTVDGTSIVDLPSYFTGRLRDIGKYIFQLKPLNIDHDFNLAIEPVDTSFDAIIIRIHGAPAAAGSGRPSQLICRVASNQEVIYDESEVESRYHTNSIRDDYNLKVAQKKLCASQLAARYSPINY